MIETEDTYSHKHLPRNPAFLQAAYSNRLYLPEVLDNIEWYKLFKVKVVYGTLRETLEWILENTFHKFGCNSLYWYFEDEQDAILFKLWYSQ